MRRPSLSLPSRPLRPARSPARLPDDSLGRLLANLDGMLFRARSDDRWTLEYASAGCLALTGYRPDELCGAQGIDARELIHPEDFADVRRAMREAVQGGRRYEVEYRLRHREGSLRWVLERGAEALSSDGEHRALEGIVQDISARKASERQLAEAERRYRSIFENAVEGMFQSSPEGRYLTVNPALARMYGYDSPDQLIDELQDIEHTLYLRPERRRQFVEQIERHGSVSGFESEIRRRDGSVVWISETARAVHDQDGTLQCYEGTVETITERKRYEEEIRYQASHDALTGLPNRALLHDRLQVALQAARRSGERVLLAFIDLDQFKFVNDSMGHAAGDELLVIVAGRLRQCLRQRDIVARQGGDEFVVLFGGNEEAADVQRLAETVLMRLAQPCAIAGREVSLSCSIGIAAWPEHAQDADTLLRCADMAMYRAKELGRNNVQVFDARLHRHSSERLDMLADLRRAIEREELVLHYEPQFAAEGLRIVGIEALVRWRRADGLVSPGHFIPLAEETGLIQAIGSWVLREACRQNRAWQDAGLARLPISVNLSRRQLVHGDIATEVADVLADTGLPAADLQLEVTESMVMHDPQRSIAMLHRLRDLGVAVAVDDFGAGYSNLSEIRRLPATLLKVDRSFIAETHSESGAAITRAIISLARILGLKVLAEGVETEAQLRFLQRHDCDYVQGFHLGRAEPAERFARRLDPALAGRPASGE